MIHQASQARRSTRIQQESEPEPEAETEPEADAPVGTATQSVLAVEAVLSPVPELAGQSLHSDCPVAS
jgi:hypothetical protein